MKLVKESVEDFLKSKSEKDVMKDFYDITPSSFPKMENNYLILSERL